MAGEKLTVGAVGVGPMGTILAGCLAEAGAEIVVADLPHRIAQVRNNGLQIIRADRQYDYPVRTVDSILELADARPDAIFISTKTSLLESLMSDVAQAAGKDCLVISAQNGIGPEDVIARYVGPDNAARMVINYAAGMDEEGIAHVAWFNPPNFFGHLTKAQEPRLASVVEMLNSVDVPTDMVDSFAIQKRAFLKTILNSALMPMCAVMGLTMKQALDGNATRKLAEDLVKEGVAVGKRLGYDYGEDICGTCMGYLEKGGDHHPSMSVDLKAGRRTEIDFLNGKILELGREFDDLNLDVNRVLVSLIMAQEVRDGTRRPDELPECLGCT